MIMMDNPQESQDTVNDYTNWKFIYDDVTYPNLPDYPSGYYLNIKTNEKHSFEQGIKEIIGDFNESRVYNMWWLENG